MSSARVARLIAARRSFSRSTIGSGEAGRATGGDFGAGAGAGTGAATTRRGDGDLGSGAGTGAGTGAATTGTGFFTARRAVRPL